MAAWCWGQRSLLHFAAPLAYCSRVTSSIRSGLSPPAHAWCCGAARGVAGWLNFPAACRKIRRPSEAEAESKRDRNYVRPPREITRKESAITFKGKRKGPGRYAHPLRINRVVARRAERSLALRDEVIARVVVWP